MYVREVKELKIFAYHVFVKFYLLRSNVLTRAFAEDDIILLLLFLFQLCGHKFAMSKPTTFNPLSPASYSSGHIVAYAYVLGLMMKWCDVIGDKELYLTEEQYGFHSKLAIIVFSLLSAHYCLINVTCCAMGSGLIVGLIMGMKIDIIEHIIPAIVILSAPFLIAHFFKDASWNGLVLSSSTCNQGIVTFIFIFAVSCFEEIFHEMVDDHPNEAFRYFIDKRPIAPIITAIVAFLMSKTELASKGVRTLCEWNMIFVTTTVFQFGYETMRHVRDYLNATVLAGNV